MTTQLAPGLSGLPPTDSRARSGALKRHALVVATVLAAHGLGLWALQAGLLQQPQQPVPEELISATVLAPETTPTPQLANSDPEPARSTSKPAPRRPAPPQPAPSPNTAAPSRTPSPQATGAATPTASTAAQSAPATGSPQGSAPAVATAPAPARVELPSSSADYLNNPRPPYPPLSKRLGEQGKVVLHVLIETDGSASTAEVRASSGYERLDQAALQTVLRWRYVPGKRNGVAEAMWFNIPINFVLE